MILVLFLFCCISEWVICLLALLILFLIFALGFLKQSRCLVCLCFVKGFYVLSKHGVSCLAGTFIATLEKKKSFWERTCWKADLPGRRTCLGP